MASFVDFGYCDETTTFDKARQVLLFVCGHPVEQVGVIPGPAAVLDASRYIELYEMQLGESPMDHGACAQLMDSHEPIDEAIHFANEALAHGKHPFFISPDRRTTARAANCPTVAFWGKVGRAELDENTLAPGQRTVIAGVRAASQKAFQTAPADVTILTAQALMMNHELLVQALQAISEPVHLCVDLDVLSPGTAQNSRSIEPGGLDWYSLTALMDIVATGPGLRSVDITGTMGVAPKTPAAVLCAQMLLRSCALFHVPNGNGA